MAQSPGPGNLVNVQLSFENVTEVITAFGERGVPAKRVAQAASQGARKFLASDATVGPYLADQLMLPLALLRGGEYTTLRPTPHTRTNAAILNRFLGDGTVSIGEEEPLCRVTVRGR